MSFTAGNDPSALIPPGGLPMPDMAPGQRLPPLPNLPEADALLDHEAVMNPDGSVDLVAPEPAVVAPDLRTLPWGTNFAEHLPQHVLSALSTEVLDGVRADIDSNAEHYATLTEGLEALGLKKERLDYPFPEAAGARSSLALKAAVRFNASAMGELMPAAGPVRTQLVGSGDGIEAAAQRKQAFLNHHLTVIDEGYYPDFDQGLFLNGVLGSIFRMVYRDPLTGQPRSRYRTPFNLVVSATASDAHGAGRFTEIDTLPPAEVKRLQVVGHYRMMPLGSPYSGDDAESGGQLRAMEGRTPSDRTEDTEHTIYTQRLVTEIAGLEHLGDDGAPTGLPLPWRVVVDKDSGDVLRVDRDWDPTDQTLQPREHFAHYRYFPGLGYYGIGFAHLLATATDAATTMIRQGLNANTLISFPGGFRVKGARLESNNAPIGPCEFREIDTSGLDIRTALMPLPYRDVPPSFVPLLQYITSDGEMLGNVAEQQVGEGRQDAPVGTTLALIEQAVRVESAVIKRCHTSQRKELRLIAKLFAEDPHAVYPYLIDGKPGVPIAPDFQNPHDIVPVSDPNVPTQVQRLALAQAKLTLAGSAPQLYDMREAHRSMLRTSGSDDAEIARLMPDKPQGVPSDPVTELGMAVAGAPLAVHPMQIHAAHIQAHMAQAQMPGLPPSVVQALVAHIGEHFVALYRAEASQALGVPLPPMGQQLPPAIEQQMSMQFAQVAGALTAKLGPLLTGAGDDGKAAVEREKIAQDDRELEFKAVDSERKAQQAARQDAGEAMRDTMEHKDSQAERELRLQEMAHEERMAALTAAGSLARGLRAPTTPQRGLV